MTLSTRLTVAMVALVLVTTAVLGVLNYRHVIEVTKPRALARLDANTHLNALLLDAALRSTRADAKSAQASTTLRDLLALGQNIPGSSGGEPSDWRHWIEARFAAELAAKPDYYIIRIIGPQDQGRELVRVDRLAPGGGIRAVPAAALAQRGDRSYVEQGMAIPPGEVSVSRIEYNKTPTGLAMPYVPTIRTMAPIDAADGTRLGLLVLNTDLSAHLARIRASAESGNLVFVIDDQGDYLLHPDPTQEFGFERGKRSRIQDDFPSFTALLNDSESRPQLITDRGGNVFGVGWDWVQIAGGPRVAVVEMRPYHLLVAVQMALRNSTVAGGAVAVLVAMLVAILLARSLSKPLVKITRSIEAFSSGRGPIQVQPGGSREIGVLADAFTRMTEESQRKAVALAEQIEQRTRIADVLQYTIDNMVDPVLVADANGMVILTNPAARELFGPLSGVGVLNTTRSFDRFDCSGEPLPTEQSPLLRAYRGETVVNFEFAVQPFGSERRSFLVANGRAVRNEAGQIQGAVMVYHDITKTKKAEAALRRSEQMSRAIIDTAIDAFVQFDARGKITDWSPHAEALLGWTRAEAIGRDLGRLAAMNKGCEIQNDYRRFLERIAQGTAGVDGHRFEIEAVRRDGSSIPLEISMTALRTDDGFVVNAFMRDLTEKIAFEEQLRQSQKMESIGQLTGGIAHDFNNMLTVITGTIDLILDGVSDKPHLAAIAKLISESADRGSELTRLLLAFARKQPLRPDETEVNTLVAGLRGLLRPTLGEQIDVKTILAPDIWPVYVDRGQLESALLNLSVNARDAMPKGGTLLLETSNVAVDAELAKRLGNIAVGDYVMITITDSGCGIPEAIRSKVFDPFFTTKEVGKGTGLGLSMVYGFIKQSGGHIDLFSEVGVGTTFKLYLPRAASAAEIEAPAPVQQGAVGGSETILVVEDDAMVRSYVNAQLKSLGYTTLSVGSAAAALSLCDSDASFDLLFTDVVMPGDYNGVQLAAEMVKRRPDLKVLFTSGYSENALIHNDRIDSDVLLLSKPYRRADLARMIRHALALPAQFASEGRRRAASAATEEVGEADRCAAGPA